MTSQEPRGATVAQLRDDIDSGRTGDKIGGLDPAAAPLGVDDEAAGTPPSPETVQAMRELERKSGPPSDRRNAAEPALQPDGRGAPSHAAPAILAGALLAVVLAAALFVLL